MPLKEIDRDVEVLTASALLSRLWHIEADIKYMKESIENLDDSYHDIDTRFDELEDSKKIEKNVEVMPTALIKWEELYTRLWNIESDIKVMGQVVTENTLTLSKIEERIAIMQEKIDGIN